MVANLKRRDLYPVLLFISIVFMGGLVGARNLNYVVESTKWGKNLIRENSIGVCKDSNWPIVAYPACRDQLENEIISPAFQGEEVHQRISLVGKLTNH